MPSPKIPLICDVCADPFLSDASNAKRSRGGHYCSRKCYYLRHGATLEERFWRRVEKTEGCWLWRGSVDEDGYGSIGSFGNADRMKSHRYSWALHHGPIPEGLYVLHNCNTLREPGDTSYRRCVNPAHLFLGTNDDNMRDMVEKKRSAHGERNSSAKLTAEQVRAIRLRYHQGSSVQSLADEFGVRWGTAKRIVSGISYRHVT